MQGWLFYHRPLSAARLGCLVPPVVEVHIWVQCPYPIQWVKQRERSHLRANPGFGYSVLSLLTVVYLQSTSFIGRIFFGLSVVGMALFQTGQWALSWPLGGIRVWKLSSTYPDEKSSSFSLLTHKPTRNLLAIPNIPVGMGALYEGPMTRLVPPAHGLRRHLSQEIKKIINLLLHLTNFVFIIKLKI